jgi:hypothetical protein
MKDEPNDDDQPDLFSYEPPEEPREPTVRFNGGDSLAEAREWVMANRDDGVRCPCCDRYAKRYWRQLHSGVITYLIKFLRVTLANPDEPWHHYRTFGNDGQDYRKAQAWELIEPRPGNEDPDKKQSGYWRLLPKGIDFLYGRTTVPKYAIIYNDTLEGFDGPQVTVVDCLTKKFSYPELMEGIPADTHITREDTA